MISLSLDPSLFILMYCYVMSVFFQPLETTQCLEFMDGYFEMNNANGLRSQLLVYTTTTKEITIILSDGLVSHGYHVTNCFTAFRDEQDTTIIMERDQDSGNILFIEMDVVNCELILVMIPGSDGFLKLSLIHI